MATKEGQGKVFINYRRSDTWGVAGRLSDSLVDYFGEGRVFRDVEGIRAGANFETVLQDTVEAADAVIVLIGPGWLEATDDQGRRRLEDQDDWVVREIAAALQNELPVFPVLIEDTPMPRAEDLPESLKPMVRLNALHISDKRWAFDVERLAKVVAFDIPGSVEEKRLRQFQVGTSAALLLTLLGLVVRVGASQLWPEAGLIDIREAAFSFVFIGATAVILALAARMVDETRRKYVTAAAWIGGAGTILVYVAVWPVPLDWEAVFLFFCAGVIASVMLFCMTLSGFKPR